MYCQKCGTEIVLDAEFLYSVEFSCPECGNIIKSTALNNDYSVEGKRQDFMILNNSELRANSRKQLQGVWGKMAFAFFIYGLITTLPQFIFFEYSPFYNKLLDTLITITLLITTGPFFLGFYVGYFMKRIRGEEILLKNIFDGFKYFSNSFLLMLFESFFIMLWTLLLIIPGIIKAYSYSMAFYIMYDDPEIKPMEAIKKSQIMMKGYKWKLFMLHLSFLGWGLLGILTLGIGYIWLTPYIYLSMGNFYENLKRNQEEYEEIKS